MAIRSGFFNSVNGDRKYKADRFAEYFATFIGNGVFPNPSTNLQVYANDDMTVTVRAGKAWINGYVVINDDYYILQIEPADGVLNRIDRVVLRYDVVGREIKLEVKKGIFAGTPVAPALQRDADAYELGIADIYVGKGAISITQANITDLRLNTSLCGIVHGTVNQVDTTTLFDQYLSWYQQRQAEYEADLTNWTTAKQNQYDTWTANKQAEYQNWYDTTTTIEQAEIDAMQAQFQQDWDTWFATVQNALDGDTAGNLLNLVENHKNDKNNPHNVTVEQIGAETPSGAQAKVDALAGEGNTTTVRALDGKVNAHKADGAHVPKGVIVMWGGLISAMPEGWALCDGQNGTPDLRDRFIVGAGGEYSIGETGGEKEVVLDVEQMPSHDHSKGTLVTGSAGSHSHSGSTSTGGSHSHSENKLTTLGAGSLQTGGSASWYGNEIVQTGSAGSHSHNVSVTSAGSHSHGLSGSTDSAGGDQPIENRPPYYALAFIIKL